MSSICPTVTAYNPYEYKEQINRIVGFVDRIHIDIMDGVFAPTVSVNIHESWWPKAVRADLHIMHINPMIILKDILSHHVNLVIVHAESQHVSSFVHQLHERRIKVGIALLPETPVQDLHHFINVIDHVLVFSGKLGFHGGTADLALLDKVRAIKAMRPDIEIGWDGGINDHNIRKLADAGVSVFNVGAFIQHSDNPQGAYQYLQELLQS